MRYRIVPEFKALDSISPTWKAGAFNHALSHFPDTTTADDAAVRMERLYHIPWIVVVDDAEDAQMWEGAIMMYQHTGALIA